MKALKVIMFVLLVVGAGAVSAQDKSPAILMQEGIYAEETEGNLDKAIEIYQQVIEQSAEVELVAARATLQLGMCHLKKGDKDKAAEYFQQVVSKYPTQAAIANKAKQELEKIKPETKTSVFEEVDGQVLKFITEKYGEITGEAGKQNLYHNSHVYYVDPNFTLYNGGIGFYHNWTGQTITGKTKLSGTSYPNQTLYDTTGQKLDVEIVPDNQRKNFYQIFWIPKEPLAPEESLYYGWSIDNSRGLPSKTGQATALTMQNQFGSPAIETFFLVLPKDLRISQSNPATGSQELLDFNVYWWSKTVRQGENHVEQIQLQKDHSEQYAAQLNKNVMVSIAKSPDGDRLAVQYAAIEICKAADVPYQWDKSQKLAGEKAKRYIEPVNFENTAANEALSSILEPVGLKYAIDANGVYLINTKEWVQSLVEDFFKHNYRDITSRKTIEWGEPVTDVNGNVSISYKYEMIIWDKDKFLANEIFTFDKNGKYLKAEKVEGFPKPLGKVEVSPEDVSTKESVQKLVEKFFSRNYRDITSRKTIEWGELNEYPNGNVSIRYKFEAVIRGKDKVIMNKLFTFDKNGQYVSAEDVEAADSEKGKDENSSFLTPEKTIQSFMSAAATLDVEKAMEFVAPDSHDYNDTKETLTDSANPFNLLYRSIDQTAPVKFIDVKVKDTMCEAKWQFILKKDFTIKGHTFKAGDPFELDGNLHKYGDKWLITGI